MNTWKDEEPPVLPPLTWPARIRGAIRLGVLLNFTGVAVVFFLIGRAFRNWFGDRVVFHFWIARMWSRVCLRLCGLRLHVTGAPIWRGSLVANHASWLDILSLRATRLIYFVSKAEVANWPGVGFITKITGTIFIERRRSHAKKQEQMLRERMAKGQLLIFFPEGTSSDGLRVLPFKSSLFSAFFDHGKGADIRVQPVSVRYRPSARSGLPDNVYGWWGDMDFGSHIWEIVCRSSGGLAEVVFHEPVLASQFPDRKTLAEYTQTLVTHGVMTGKQAAIEPPAQTEQPT